MVARKVDFVYLLVHVPMHDPTALSICGLKHEICTGLHSTPEYIIKNGTGHLVRDGTFGRHVEQQ